MHADIMLALEVKLKVACRTITTMMGHDVEKIESMLHVDIASGSKQAPLKKAV